MNKRMLLGLLASLPFVGKAKAAPKTYEVACMVWVVDAPCELVGYGHFATEDECLAFIRAKHRNWAEMWCEEYGELYVQPADFHEGWRKHLWLGDNSLVDLNQAQESGFMAAVKRL